MGGFSPGKQSRAVEAPFAWEALQSRCDNSGAGGGSWVVTSLLGLSHAVGVNIHPIN